MNVADYAATALLRTIADYLPARLRAADAERHARIVCAPGPYVFEEDAELVLQGSAAAIPMGSYTAAELADLLTGIPELAAADDGEGRLELASTRAPSATASSTLVVGRGSANPVLGLDGRRSTVTALAVGEPALKVYPYSEAVADVIDEPSIFLESAREVPDTTPAHLHLIAVRLQVLVPGTLGDREATIEATMAVVDHLRRVVEEGDGRGRCMVGGRLYGKNVVRCYARPWVLEPKTWVRGGGPGGGRAWGRALPEFEIKVWAPPS